ncbi:MAG: hypothetical protein ACRDKT_11590 [Actinomycetota bacterium]
MKRSVAVPLWDLFLIASMLLPIPIAGAFADGRSHAALIYLSCWAGIFLLAYAVGRIRGVSLRSYLRHL